jgi:imipenem/basic amino acid-specific outer membrane pore
MFKKIIREKMKKLKKTSLALAVVSALGISANASTLSEALSGGKVSGEIRSITAMASQINSSLLGPYRNANSSAVALQLKYSTGDYKGFKANVGFQVGHSLDIEKSDANSAAAPWNEEKEGRITAEGSILHIANLQYNIAKTEIKAGRQAISTPLMSNSTANPMVDTFNALSIASKDLDNTEIKAYVIKDWIERYSADNSARITHYEKPTLSLYVKNTSIPNLTLEGQYLDVRDDIGNPLEAPVKTNGSYSTYFTNAEYKLPVSMPLTFGAYYSGADYNGTVTSAGSAEANIGKSTMYGAKLAGKIGETGFKLAYTKVADDNTFIGCFGHVPHFFKYNGAQMFTDWFYSGVSSTSLTIIPKIIPNVFTLFAISSYSQTNEGKLVSNVDMDGATEIQADIRYNITKDFNARLQLAQVDLDNNTLGDDKMSIGKLYLTYKF